MKIAIIDMDNLKNPFWAAGQARATREVAKRLTKSHSVTVYSSKYPSSKDYKEEGIKYIHVGLGSKSSKLNNIVFILQIPFLVKKIKADLIIENFNAPTSVSFAPLFTKVPIIALPTMFNAAEFSRKYHLPFHLIEKLGMKFYKYMMPYSEIDAAKAAQLNPKLKYKIIPQGVGKEFFEIKHKKPEHILFLGRFDTAQKGIDLLLYAYAKIANKVKYPLVIAGRGPDENKINQLIKELRLEKRVKIVGAAYGEKKIDLISKAIFVAFPSRHDELSLWALEALASGMPLVAFNLPESKWMDEKVALKAKPFDTGEYGELLVKATNKAIYEAMRKNARKLARGYTWENVAKEFENFMQSVIKLENSY